MKNCISFLLLSVMIAFQANAHFSLGYSLGYGSYKMNDMKVFLDDMVNVMRYQLPGIPVDVVDHFPGFITHGLDLSYRIKRHEIGLRGTYLTTGGKIAYSDYTGEYSGKILLNGFCLGANYRFHFPVADFDKNGSLGLFVELSPGITFSKLKSKEYLKIFGQRQDADENLNFKAKGAFLFPQLGIRWFTTKHIGIQFSGGYFFQFGSHLKFNGVDTKIKSDWSGVRMNGGLFFSW